MTPNRVMGCVVAGLAIGGAVVGRALVASNDLPRPLALHGTLMILAWGGVIPLGATIARHFKVLPGQGFPEAVDNPFWWNWHRILQYGGMAVALAALGLAVAATGIDVDTTHARLGLVVMTLGTLQVLSPVLRGTKGGPTDRRADPADPATWRGDHYDMTRRRRLFEAWHKTTGWLLVGLAAVTILLGIDLAGAPPWLLLVAGLLQGALVCALVDGRLRRRWVDTHAALWGPGRAPPRHGGSDSAKPAGSPRPGSAGVEGSRPGR